MSSGAPVRGPLAGVRVIDWTLYGVGPFAGSLLAALGADVIKVETPPRGDPQQYIPPTVNGLAGLYINFNTGKRCIQLDLKDEQGRQQFWKLIDTADLMLTNFRAGTAEKLGFGPKEVFERNPNLVFLVSTGWGEFGPMKFQGGGDNWVQAFCGWCSVTGNEGGQWEFLRFLGHIDLNASCYIAAALLTGLIARQRAGGQYIGLSMLEAALAMQSNRISEYLAGGVNPLPLGSAYAVVAPSQAFRCQDSAYVAVCAETQSQWTRLAKALGREDLISDARFTKNSDRVENRALLALELEKVFVTKPVAWWVIALSRARVPVSKFWDWDLIRNHPQVLDNEHIVTIDTGRSGVVYTNGAPWKFAEEPAEIRRNPYTGEHTEEILSELAGQKPRSVERAAVPDKPPLPFEGLRVLELAAGIAGPYCGQLLADQGAAVTKVEPAGGDYLREWGPPFNRGVGTAFQALNRNKRIEPSDQESIDKARLLELARTADVVIVDAIDPDGKPPALGYDDVRTANSKAVYCSVSAYGEKGPMAGLPGSELTVQAMTNTWAGLGEIGKPPLRMGSDQATMTAGVVAYQGVLAALWRRSRTGRGDAVAVSSLGALHTIKGMHWTCLSNPDQWPGLHLTVWTDPPQHGYSTADLPVLFSLNRRLGAPNDEKTITGLVVRLGGEGLPEGMSLAAGYGDPANPTSPQWKTFWSGLFKRYGWRELAGIFEEFGGELVPFLDYPGLDAHPQIEAMAPFVPMAANGDKVRAVRVPWRLGAYPDGFTYRIAEEAAPVRSKQ